MNIRVFTDGGARGNPGFAAIGVFIENDKNETLAQIGKKIGIATNNVAEYKAVLEGLSWLAANVKTFNKETQISFFLDSQLVCSQIRGIYKVKNKNLQELLFQIRVKEKELGIPVLYNFVRREENINADKLVNMALDNKL